MDRADVRQILGYKSVRLMGPDWPRTLGEIPGFEDGFYVDVDPAGARYHVKPTEPVIWEKWTDRDDPNRWIAIGFFNEGDGGTFSEPWVIAKKKSGF